MKTLVKSLALVALLALQVSAAQAALIFNLTGTVSNPGVGYTLGAPVSFTWTLPDSVPETNGTEGWEYLWYEEGPVQPTLYSNVTGTGLTGAYTRPSNPFAYLRADGDSNLLLFASTDAEPLGLFAPDSSSVTTIRADVRANAFSTFLFPFPIPTPSDFFASYLGTYNLPLDGGAAIGYVNTNSGQMEFTATTLTISGSSAAPEPGQIAASLLLLVGLGGYAIAKRRRINSAPALV